MKKETADPETKIQDLLKSASTPAAVRKAIYAFQKKQATINDVIAVGQYGIFIDECFTIMEKEKIPALDESFLKAHAFKKERPMFPEDFLALFSKIHQEPVSTEDALHAFSVLLLTAKEVIQIINKNGENLPQTIEILSQNNPEWKDVFDVFQREKNAV